MMKQLEISFPFPGSPAILTSGLVLLGLLAGGADAADVHYDLTSRMNGQATLSDGTSINTWGFRLGRQGMGGPEVPGPVLYANEGDRVFLHFFNMSPEDHTIHPHGLDVDQENDGVPQTSFAVPMMGRYTYEFVAPHAGSYNYHCHVETIVHLQMGMYGAINILPPDGSNHVYDGGPAFDFERTWITAEIDLAWNTSPGNNDLTIYEPDYFLVNGKDGPDVAGDSYTTFDLDGSDVALVRIGNMGYLPVRYGFDGLVTEVVQSDGRTLPQSFPGEGLLVTPGERFDVLVSGGPAGVQNIHLEYLDLYDGQVLGTADIPVNVTETTGVDTPDATAALWASAPAPSPFRESVRFELTRADEAPLLVQVLDVRGRLLTQSTLVPAAGSGEFVWDGRDAAGERAADGIYYVRFSSGSNSLTRKVTLLH